MAACTEYSTREQVLIDEGIGHHPFVTMIISGGAPIVAYGHPHIDAYWGCSSEQVRAKAHADLDCVSARHHEIMGNSDQEAGQRGFVASDAFDELIGGVPTTARGLRAMVSYLAADPNAGEVFRLDDNRTDMLLVSIDEALQALHPAAA